MYSKAPIPVHRFADLQRTTLDTWARAPRSVKIMILDRETRVHRGRDLWTRERVPMATNVVLVLVLVVLGVGVVAIRFAIC